MPAVTKQRIVPYQHLEHVYLNEGKKGDAEKCCITMDAMNILIKKEEI